MRSSRVVVRFWMSDRARAETMLVKVCLSSPDVEDGMFSPKIRFMSSAEMVDPSVRTTARTIAF